MKKAKAETAEVVAPAPVSTNGDGTGPEIDMTATVAVEPWVQRTPPVEDRDRAAVQAAYAVLDEIRAMERDEQPLHYGRLYRAVAPLSDDQMDTILGKATAKDIGVMRDVRLSVIRKRVEEIRAEINATQPIEDGPKQDAEQLAERIVECEMLAAPILDAEDPLAIIEDTIKQQGYGGDTRPPRLLYVAATTRLLFFLLGQMVANVLVKGGSSTGKSFLIDLVMRLLCPMAYRKIDGGASEKALVHLQEDLRHRIIVMKEADSLPEIGPAATFIRGLIHDGKGSYMYPVRDEHGVWRTIEKVHEGPTMLITSSVGSLGPQLDTRLFTLDAPDDLAYIRAALKAQAQAELHGIPDLDPALLAFQEYLQLRAPWHVVIPFDFALAELLGRGNHNPRVLRDHSKLMSLVKAVVIIRHRHRDRDESGRWVARLEDYGTVLDLVDELFAAASSSGVTEKVREVVNVVQEHWKPPVMTAAAVIDNKEVRKPLTRQVIAERLRDSQSQATVYRKIAEALNGGWLVRISQERGPDVLALGEPLPSKSGLPAVEELRTAYRETEVPDPPRSRRYPPTRRTREKAEI